MSTIAQYERSRRRSATATSTTSSRAWVALSRQFVHEAIEIELNRWLGLVLPTGDGHRGALSFVVSDGRIARIDAIRNPEKLRRLSPGRSG